MPFVLYEDKRLDSMDKDVFALIYWYEKLKDGKCTASNDTIAKMLGVTARAVSGSLMRLDECGYITRSFKDTAKKNRLCINTLISFRGKNDRTIDVSTIELQNDRDRTMDVQISNKSSNRNTVSVASLAQKVSKETRDTQLTRDVKEFFLHYDDLFLKRISDKKSIYNYGQCVTLAKPHIKTLGLNRMRELLNAYFASNDQIFKDNAWSLPCFLSTKIINRLNQTS